jgi:fructose-1,6-bisphosphatase/inositol monophosphatase family enzyme
MNEWCERLLAMGRSVRDTIVTARASGEDMATAVAQEGGDTIFAIDRHVEPIIERHIEAWPRACKPLELIAEGMGDDGRMTFGSGSPQYRLIVDPIDGTRNIMYDKRSAWFIAAVVPGEHATLRNAIASVIVELPTSKAGWCDEYWAMPGQPTQAQRCALMTRDARPHHVTTSTATTLKNGFGQVSNFFPGTKRLASELMEQIVTATLGDIEPGSAAVFDDQYITTAGQMVELMVGHDRFCCDLRPLFYRIIEQQTGRMLRGLECHPYDLAGMLAAQQAGVVLTDGLGRPLDAPLDVHTGVHWCGYANASLRESIEPVIQSFFKQEGILS